MSWEKRSRRLCVARVACAAGSLWSILVSVLVNHLTAIFKCSVIILQLLQTSVQQMVYGIPYADTRNSLACRASHSSGPFSHNQTTMEHIKAAGRHRRSVGGQQQPRSQVLYSKVPLLSVCTTSSN